jgi:cold shock CspA family protein/ribosome-associated translation inhibitor RaiA
MQIEPEIALRHVELNEVAEELIREGISDLDKAYDGLTSCHLMVEMPEGRDRAGNLYHVRIDLRMPGHEIVIRRTPAVHHLHEDLTQALGEAFDQAQRELVEFARQQRGDEKAHKVKPHGRVVRLFPDYGFIENADGLEVYFHRNSLVRGDFDHLEEGSRVRFAVEQGDEGPQASTVQVVGKHHLQGRPWDGSSTSPMT